MIRQLESRPSSPNDQALQLTGRDYISYSAISTYLKCPLQYFLRYVVGEKPAFVPSALTFGRAIHAAIEQHCWRVLAGAEPPGLDELLAAYDQAWKTDKSARVRFGRGESERSLRDLARRMLTAFHESPYAQPGGTILAIEEEFRAPVIPDCPDLFGRIDLVTVERGVLRITDYKTARSRWSRANIQESAPQLLLYAELLRPLADELGINELQLEWVVLTKSSKPVVESHTLTPDPRQLLRAKAMVQRAWHAIASGHFYPSPSARNCSTCPFWTPCQEWEG